MKIPSHGQRERVGLRPDSPSRGGGGGRGVRRSSEPAAQVAVSASARAFEDLRAPERPDAAKVQRLRDAIARGELRIDPERIAARMIEEEL